MLQHRDNIWHSKMSEPEEDSYKIKTNLNPTVWGFQGPNIFHTDDLHFEPPLQIW